MSITRAQQARQLYKKGSKEPVKQAGVMNYMPSEMVTVPKIAKSSPDTPTAKLAYITPEEQDILIDLNLYGSLDGKPNRGPGGIPSLEGDFGSPTGQGYSDNAGSYGGAEGPDVSGSKDTGTGNYQVTNQTVQDEYNKNRKKREADAKQKEIEKKFKADAKKTRKKMRDKVLADKKIRKERISNILSKNKNYLDPRTGQIVDLSNYGLSPRELADLKSLGIDPNKEGPMTDMQQDVFDQMMEKNDRFSGVNLENFQNKFDLPTTGITSLDLVTGLLEGPLSKGSKINKEFFTDDVLGAGKFKYDGNVVNPEIFSMLDPTEMQEIYGDYDTKRKSGEIDAYGNPTNLNTGGGDDQVIDPCKGPNPPAYCFVDDKKEEEEVNPRDYTGIAPRFMGSSFDFTGLAEGGRVAAQQGGIMSQQGGIMPRLSDLSGDVSSAEQMLQEINQRLQSAESTLGEGGGMRGTTIAPNMSPLENAMRSQQPLGQPGLASIANYTPFAGETFSQVPEQFRSGFDEYKKENPIGIGGQAISYSMLPDGNRVSFGDTASASGFSDYLNSIGQPNNTYQGMEGFAPQPGGPMQSALQSPLAGAIRQGAMDGGRMRQMEMMEDEDDPTGGIMDLESGRQMYFLGKLVKKAGRAIKKVVKSPIGKAALLYFGGNALMGKMGGLSGLKGSLFGTAGGTARMTPGILGKLGITGGGGAMMPTLKGGLSLGLGIPFALDALGVGKEEEDGIDLDAYYKTQGIDIDAIRNNPNRILARRFVGMADGGRINYQEGGDAEPVAKKTMPLLDMDGKEMDLRAEGGFVPLGRMERADDVPARLSKNEFVFTADAVRNAGEGDIDKGAEVMYNMMKNLESGGEVSEESQGLDGAREMFQTSQRLEEVL